MVQEIPHFIGESMQEEILKEMEKYPVLTFADIIRALRSHPEWLEELRKLILTEELLELPKKFDELLKRVDRIERDIEELKQDVAILKQDVAILKQEVAILKQDVAYLKGEFGRFKGKDFERTIRERYYAYFGRLLRKTKLIPMEDLLPKLDELEESGVITEEEGMSILQVDIVLRGEIKSTKKAVVLAVEVSYSLFEDDLARAEERARILAHVLKEEVIPCVVTVEVKEDVEKMADEKGILVIKADY
jgi:polyhydroxyalkanoate synthesis regulator phasin